MTELPIFSDTGVTSQPIKSQSPLSPHEVVITPAESVVLGYHGTNEDAAAAMLDGNFKISTNDYDWFGNGVYFWQDAPRRAREWAQRRFGRDSCVVMAELNLRDCIDLLDIGWGDVFNRLFVRYKQKRLEIADLLPHQFGKAHRLDCDFCNFFSDELGRNGHPVRAFRGAFAEGEPIFHPSSALLAQSHVQIAVRDTSIIRAASIIDAGGQP